MAKTKEDNKTVQGITREAMWKKYDELKLKNFTNESLIKVAKACNMKANSKKQMQRMRGFLVTMVQSMEANKENNKKSAERANRNEASEESDESVSQFYNFF